MIISCDKFANFLRLTEPKTMFINYYRDMFVVRGFKTGKTCQDCLIHRWVGCLVSSSV